MSFHRYQKDIIDFVMNRIYVKNDIGAGVFADPGLGKTYCSLEIIDQLRQLDECKRALVLAPVRVLDLVWPNEIQKFGYDFQTTRVEKTKRPVNYSDIDFCSPDSLHKLVEHAGRWDLLVIDESPKFKCWSTKRMKYLRKLLPSIPKRIILTGTPTPNSLMDLHSQIYILDNGFALGKNVTTFRSRFCRQGGWNGRQWFMREDKRQEMLDLIAPMVIRMDAESNLDMPKLVFNDVPCELPASAHTVHKELKRQLSTLLENGERITVGNAAAVYAKLRQVANGFLYDKDKNVHDVHNSKIDALAELVEELNGKPLLVFYQFDADAKRIQAVIGKCPTIRGGLSKGEAQRNIESWLSGKDPTLLVQEQSGSHGLNLQTGGCRHVAFVGISDNAGDYEQAYRRVYRQGADGSVFVHRFFCQKSVDEIILGRVDGKIETQTGFLDALKRWADGK